MQWYFSTRRLKVGHGSRCKCDPKLDRHAIYICWIATRQCNTTPDNDGHLCDCIPLLEDNDSSMTSLLVMTSSVTVYSPLRAMTHLWPVCWWWPSLWLYTPPWGQWLTYNLSVGDDHLCDYILLLEDNDSPITCLLVMTSAVTVYFSLRTVTHL